MKRRAITWVMALCSTVAPMLGTKTTSASEAPVASSSGPTAPARPLAVDVALVGGASSQGSLAVRIRSWFGTETRLSIETERTLSAERVLAPLAAGHVAVWVTLRSPNEARLYFAAPSERGSVPRYLVRDVPLEWGLDEVGSERVAQVVHSSVSALFEGAIEGTARPALERTLGGATPRSPTTSENRSREQRPRPRD